MTFDTMFNANTLSDTDLARGYSLTHIDNQTVTQPKDLLYCETQEQTICAEEQVYRITTNTRSLEKPHSLGNASQTDDLLASVPRIEEVLEEKVIKAEQTGTLGQYVVCGADTEERRQVLGLPQWPLSRHRNVSGGDPQVACLSLTETYGGFHKQPQNLQSVRIVWRGSPRVWVVVAPRHSEKLEALLVSRRTQSGLQCSQFVTHEGVLVPPSALRHWHISFSIFVQNPGDLMWTDYGVYCYYWNMGTNVVEETPWCEHDWWLPPFYQRCHPDLVCGNPRIWPTSPLRDATDHPLGTIVSTETPDSARSEESVQEISHRPEPSDCPGEQGNTPKKSSTHLSTSSEGSPDSVGTDFFISPHRPSQRRLPTRQHFPLIYDFDGMSEQSMADFVQEHGQRGSSRGKPGHEAGTDGRSCPAAAVDDSEIHSSANVVQAESNPAATSPASTSPASSDPAATSPASTSPAVASPASTNPATTKPPEVVTISTPTETWQPVSVDVPSEKEDRDLVAGQPQDVQVLNVKGLTIPHNSAIQMELEEIENLIQVGIEYQRHIIWPLNESPPNVEAMLTRFKPFRGRSSWLNDECIRQVLAYLVRDRDDVIVLDSLKVAAALKSGEAKDLIVSAQGVNLVFAPVIRQSHWFLVGLDVENRSVIVHEDEQIGNTAGYFFLETATQVYPEAPWSLRNEIVNYVHPYRNTLEDCGIRLLAAARKTLMRGPVEIVDPITLRRMFLSFLLEPVQQENQTVRLMSSLRPNLPTCATADASLQAPVFFSIDNSPAEAQDGAEHDLGTLSSAVGCTEVLADLKNISGMLRMHSTRAVSRLDMAMQTFAIGEAGGILSFLQKDLAASFVARRFSEITRSIRARPRKRGNRAKSDAYDQLEREWNKPQMTDKLRNHLRYVKSRGQKLLDITKMCAGRPLWMFFPARRMAAPADPSFIVTPCM